MYHAEFVVYVSSLAFTCYQGTKSGWGHPEIFAVVGHFRRIGSSGWGMPDFLVLSGLSHGGSSEPVPSREADTQMDGSWEDSVRSVCTNECMNGVECNNNRRCLRIGLK